MKKTCLLGFLQASIPFVVYYYLLSPHLGKEIIVIALFLAVFMGISFGLVRMGIQRIRDLSMIRTIPKSEMRNDGERIAVFGRIYPYGEQTKSPTGVDCIVCNWGIYRWVRDRNRRRNKEYIAHGNIMVPSYVRTNIDDVRLLGFPYLSNFEKHETMMVLETQWQTAMGYIQKVPLGVKTTPLELPRIFSEIEEMMTDSDGTVRKEERLIEVADLNKLDTLEEEYLLAGDEICLVGTWSAEKFGIVPIGIGSGKEITIWKGTKQQVDSTLRSGIAFRIAGGILLGIAVNAIVWLIIHKLPIQ